MIVRNTYTDGRTEIFCNTPDEYSNLCCEYNLEDCGASGKYDGCSWSHDDKYNVDVYYKCTEEQKVGGKYYGKLQKNNDSVSNTDRT